MDKDSSILIKNQKKTAKFIHLVKSGIIYNQMFMVVFISLVNGYINN